MDLFNSSELKRYSRHFTLPEVGKPGQELLKKSSVVVIGAGGLGSPVLYYLAATGVGKIGIIDNDLVDESNLQRQIMFDIHDINTNKAKTAAQKLKDLNPWVEIEAFQERLTSQNALQLLTKYDIVVDGSDNLPTKYLLNDACVILGKPLVYGSIYRFEGQVSVFNYQNGPDYRDLFPEPPPPNMVPDCSTGGVLGILPGVIGSLQANEVIKIILGKGEILAGTLLIVELLDLSFKKIRFQKDKNKKPLSELIDYEHFCNETNTIKSIPTMKELSVTELKEMLDRGEALQLIDVREPYEREIASIGGELIPLSSIVQNAEKIQKDKKVIFYCRSGKRSATAIQALQKQDSELKELYNLVGGILAWSDEIDDSVEKY